jgi:hypothetical protein
LFDNNKPRNAVTQESHGFITRDGIKPIEFRQIAHKEISKYPSATRIFNIVILRKQLYSNLEHRFNTALNDISTWLSSQLQITKDRIDAKGPLV